MMKNVITILIAAVLVSFGFQQAEAQDQEMRFGAKAGISLYNITTSVSGGGMSIDATSDSRLGFALGAYAIIPFHEMFAFQPELMFVQKGGKESDDDDDFFNGGDTELILNYLDIPLLVRFNVPVDAPVSPYLTAGPVLGIFLSGTEKFDGESESIDEGINTLNFGLSLGAGVAYNQFHFDLRYEFGLSNIFDDEEDDDDFFGPIDFDVTTSGLMLTVGYTF